MRGRCRRHRRRHAGVDRRHGTNDVTTTGRPRYAAGISYCANRSMSIFDGAACVNVSGTITPSLGAGRVGHHLYPASRLHRDRHVPLRLGRPAAVLEQRIVLPGRDDALLGADDRRRQWRDAAQSRGDQGHPLSGRSVSAIEAVNGDTVVFRIGAVNQPPTGTPDVPQARPPTRSRSPTHCPSAWRSCPRRAMRDARPRVRWSRARLRSCSTRVTE